MWRKGKAKRSCVYFDVRIPDNICKTLIFYEHIPNRGKRWYNGQNALLEKERKIKERTRSMSRLWYTSPAGEWEEALPLGNGRLGAMVYGGTDHDLSRIHLSEHTSTS